MNVLTVVSDLWVVKYINKAISQKGKNTMKLSDDEKLILFLNEKFHKISNNSNVVTVRRLDISSLGMSEQDIAKILLLLEAGNYKSTHNDFSKFWTIVLKPSCVYYFDNKKETKRLERNKWIQFWIPVTVSVGALVVSIIALVTG